MSEENVSMGDMGETTTTSNETVPGGIAPSVPDFTSIVPQEYLDKGWVKDVKDVPQFFKMFDDQKVALSRRPAGIPQDNAAPEEWAAFNKSFGVPETPEGYEFTKLPEGQANDGEFQQAVKTMFHEAGINKRQAGIIEEKWNGLMESMAQTQAAQTQQSDEEFNKIAQETFGTREAEVMKNAKGLIAQYTPETMKSHLESLPNNALIVLAGVLDGVQKDYISADKLPDDTGTPVGGMTAEDKRAKAKELMAKRASMKPMDVGYDELTAKINEYYGTA